MIFSEKEFLFLFGWDDFFQNQMPSHISSSLRIARIICEEKNLYRIQLGMEELRWASISGKMQFNAITRADYPAVGDWVLVDLPNHSERGVIKHIFTRKSALQRKQVGGTSEVQILSANIDTIFIVTSLNSDLNYRRLERYLSIAWDSGARPVILLTKADLNNKAEEITSDVRITFPAVDVHCISKNNFEESIFLSQYLRKGTTSVLVGSSGTGKSTLINFLIRKEEIKTQEVRESDEKGRHTTSARSLYKTSYGGLIIDTPGMRELQFSDQTTGVQTQFDDIEEMKQKCKFSNCAHQTEPGCTILQALADGSLSEGRWTSYKKLLAEVQYEANRKNKATRSEEKKVRKKKIARKLKKEEWL